MIWIGFGWFLLIGYFIAAFFLFAPIGFLISLFFIVIPFYYRRHLIKKYQRLVMRDGLTFRQKVREEIRLQKLAKLRAATPEEHKHSFAPETKEEIAEKVRQHVAEWKWRNHIS